MSGSALRVKLPLKIASWAPATWGPRSPVVWPRRITRAIATQGLDQARKVASEVGYRVPREELAEGTDLLILTTPYGAPVDALPAVRHTDGKTVIDISNLLTQDMSGLVVGHTTSAAEEIQRAVPGVKVVKAFNTCSRRYWGQSLAGLESAGLLRGRRCRGQGYRAPAGREHRVRAGGWRPARHLEPLGMLNIWFG